MRRCHLFAMHWRGNLLYFIGNSEGNQCRKEQQQGEEMINITWDTMFIVAITAFITGGFSALGNFFIMKYLLEHINKIKKKLRK
jgi:hypothetical protein